jgi:hypothetical protein
MHETKQVSRISQSHTTYYSHSVVTIYSTCNVISQLLGVTSPLCYDNI